MPGPYRGSCLCTTVRFEVDEFEPRTGNCHCSMCRKFHGAAYATIAEARQGHFRWTTGEDSLKGFTADNGTTRSFCANCGSSLTFFSPGADPDLVEIALGCFDDEVPVRPDAHIYVASGAKWALPEDDLPQYEAGRDSTRIK
ncbi:MAG: GFA family protein [Gammaproteobacteria bacterium]|nr:GFA family protein [Gammaproteobacteria bacterium]MDH3858226.1 GFA family protein [Gammaproteobacteria bacterium]